MRFPTRLRPRIMRTAWRGPTTSSTTTKGSSSEPRPLTDFRVKPPPSSLKDSPSCVISTPSAGWPASRPQNSSATRRDARMQPLWRAGCAAVKAHAPAPRSKSRQTVQGLGQLGHRELGLLELLALLGHDLRIGFGQELLVAELLLELLGLGPGLVEF